MPSLIPKARTTRKAVYPFLKAYPKEIFEGPKYAATLGNVLSFLIEPYMKHSDGSFERTGRPGIVTEQFFLPMPTVDAFASEIRLLNAIYDRSLGFMDAQSIKVCAEKYLNAHIFVYREAERDKWICEIKSGPSKRAGRDVPLFSVEPVGLVLNPIQVWLFRALEAKAGNNAKFSICSL